MNRSKELLKTLASCSEQLVECSSIIRDEGPEPKKEHIYKIGKALAEIGDLRTELYKVYPHLKPERWGNSLTEDDYREMFNDAVHIADEYLQSKSPSKAIEIYESFLSIKPGEDLESKTRTKIQGIRDEFAL